MLTEEPQLSSPLGTTLSLLELPNAGELAGNELYVRLWQQSNHTSSNRTSGKDVHFTVKLSMFVAYDLH